MKNEMCTSPRDYSSRMATVGAILSGVVGFVAGALLNYGGGAFVATHTALGAYSWSIEPERNVEIAVYAAHITFATLLTVLAIGQVIRRGFRPITSLFLAFALAFIGYVLFELYLFRRRRCNGHERRLLCRRA